MKQKKTLIYFIIAIVLLLIFVIIEKPFSGKMGENIGDELKLKKAKVFEKVTEKDTARIFVSINDAKTTFSLYQVEGKWAVNKKGTARADSYKMSEVWNNLSKAKEAEIISSNPENFIKFNVGENAAIVTFYDKQDKEIEKIIIGKPTPDYQSTFIRKFGKNEVLKIPAALSHLFSFSQGTNDWRDRKMISQSSENVSSLIIESPKEKTRIEKLSDGEWETFEPARKPAAKNLVDSVARIFSTLYATGFEDNENNKPLKEFSLDPPVWKITTTLKDGSSTPTLSIGKKKGDDEYYAMVKGDSQIYLLRSYQVDQICKDSDSFVPSPTPKPSPTVKPEKKDAKKSSDKKEEAKEVKKEEKPKSQPKSDKEKSEPKSEEDK